MPVDKVKIDKSFIEGVGLMQSAAIVHAIVSAGAGALGLKITAEGVETEEQQRFLARRRLPLHAGLAILQGGGRRSHQRHDRQRVAPPPRHAIA